MSSSGENKQPQNVARGLKASIHNPNVSGEAKEHAAERLQDMGEEVPGDFTGKEDQKYEYDDPDAKHGTNRVLGGYKATLKNPRVSEEAKQHARDVLDDAYRK